MRSDLIMRGLPPAAPLAQWLFSVANAPATGFMQAGPTTDTLPSVRGTGPRALGGTATYRY